MENKDKKNLILRDILAIDRTKLANQRTLLAFIGTCLHFIILGITFSKIEVLKDYFWLSIPFVVIGFIFLIIGILTYKKNKRDIDRAYNLDH